MNAVLTRAPTVTATFRVAVGLKDEGPFPTYKEALANFIERIKSEAVKCLTRQTLETACWIEIDYKGQKRNLYFDHSRDLGYEMGLLGEGSKLLPDAPEPEHAQILAAFGLTEEDAKVVATPTRLLFHEGGLRIAFESRSMIDFRVIATNADTNVETAMKKIAEIAAFMKANNILHEVHKRKFGPKGERTADAVVVHHSFF